MSATTPHISTVAPRPGGSALARPLATSPSATQTYGQILRSSALIGGSSIASLGLGIIRTKTLALLLGPAGVGLLGLYSAIADFAQSIAGLGISSSGVRQIAEAAGSGDAERIARTVTVLRRASLVLGVLGAALLLLFSRPVAILTFGNDHHTAAVALLSLAVAFRVISGGQGALIQGMRRITDLAKLGILGAFFGTIISIPAVYVGGQAGVAPALVAISATALVASWWYSRKVRPEAPPIATSEVRRETKALLKLGLAFMAGGFLMMGSAYLVRIAILRSLGFDAAGLYQAAWAVGGLYVGFILQAMGADFYPRLTAAAKDNTECNRLVNEQAQVSLLLAGPGVIATLTFAPLVMAALYSAQFDPGAPLLRWICGGMAMRVVTWPIGFIILAKGRQTLFFATELAWTVVHLGLAWVCVHWFGLNGAGIAFLGSYIFHGLLIYPLVRHLSGFRWSTDNWHAGALFIGFMALVSCAFLVLSPIAATLVGILAVVLSTAYSIRALLILVPVHQMPEPLQRLLGLFSFACRGLRLRTVDDPSKASRQE
jgi:PST family polysaccharide transporter